MGLQLKLLAKGSASDPNADYALLWLQTGQGGALILPDPTQSILGVTLLAGPPSAVPTLQWLADGWNTTLYGTTSPTTLAPGTWFIAVVGMTTS